MVANPKPATTEPVIGPPSLRRGTMTSANLDASRQFYEEFLGLECARIAPNRMLIRMPRRGGGDPATEDHGVIDVFQVSTIEHKQNVLNHWGVDVPTRADVDRIHDAAEKNKDKYALGRIMKVREQHGVYAFYMQDRDSNWWEIQQRDPGASYAPLIEAGDIKLA
jgi:catechol 2,3-dioxygenase-like lactoylglutathione lyase family enzyme